MSNIIERAEREINGLENDLKEATTDERKKEILNAIRDVERDVRDFYREEEREEENYYER